MSLGRPRTHKGRKDASFRRRCCRRCCRYRRCRRPSGPRKRPRGCRSGPVSVTPGPTLRSTHARGGSWLWWVAVAGPAAAPAGSGRVMRSPMDLLTPSVALVKRVCRSACDFHRPRRRLGPHRDVFWVCFEMWCASVAISRKICPVNLLSLSIPGAYTPRTGPGGHFSKSP